MVSCDKCQHEVSSKAILEILQDSLHKDKKNHCNQCGIQVLRKDDSDLQQVHEGVKYTCGQCSYQATSKGNVAQHKSAVHEGVKYPCEQCGHQASSKSNLARHKRAVLCMKESNIIQQSYFLQINLHIKTCR